MDPALPASSATPIPPIPTPSGSPPPPALTPTPNPQPTTHPPTEKHATSRERTVREVGEWQAEVGNPQPVSSGHPEVEAEKQGLGVETGKETAEIEVIPESPEISPELAEHVERVTRGEIELPGPIDVGTHEGQPVTIQSSAPQQPNIILPLTRGDFTAGPGQPVSSSWRWLYEFVKRIILMMPGRAVYRDL